MSSLVIFETANVVARWNKDAPYSVTLGDDAPAEFVTRDGALTFATAAAARYAELGMQAVAAFLAKVTVDRADPLDLGRVTVAFSGERYTFKASGELDFGTRRMSVDGFNMVRGAAGFPAIPQWQQEFPDYPAADMPAIPATWGDESWHNDACPSFLTPVVGGKRFQVFVDYREPTEREYEECNRFQVVPLNAEGEHEGEGTVFASDHWPDVLAALEWLSAGAPSRGAAFAALRRRETVFRSRSVSRAHFNPATESQTQQGEAWGDRADAIDLLIFDGRKAANAKA